MLASRPPVVTLTTDFGTSDVYVGQMKGAILAVCPNAVIVDLTHEIPPFDVEAGAFAIAASYETFPPGSIHVVVVDPGVGTERRSLVVRTARHVFLAPDNGVLSRVLDRDPERGAWILEAAHYRRADVAATFHGRDVFAPAAGWLAREIDPAHFGPAAATIVRLPENRFRLEPGVAVEVRVAHVDRFGNLVLDLPRRDLAPFCDPVTGLFRGTAHVGSAEIVEVRRTYHEASPGAPFLLFDAFDCLEIALRDGSAATALGLSRGDAVRVVPAVL
jgi:S-adenosylmethionine hydrolase